MNGLTHRSAQRPQHLPSRVTAGEITYQPMYKISLKAGLKTLDKYLKTTRIRDTIMQMSLPALGIVGKS